MHEYLMEATHFFLGKQRFQVVAENKADAIEKGIEFIKKYGKDNYYTDSVKVVKKLKPSFPKV